MENAKLIRNAFEKLGYKVYGGAHAPYLWINMPGKTSWQAFEEILEKAHVITTPGIGFGPSGDGFIRLSALGNREEAEEAIRRIERAKLK